ncbi:MAG: adenine phosphoribosyltransferase [Flavobacteriales bacterium]
MNSALEHRIKAAIRDVPDFPKPGILFRDITPVLEDPQLCSAVVEGFAEALRHTPVDAIAGVESRGFLFGLPLAMRLGIPFITVRKKGKLPYRTVSYNYDLEYGSAAIEMHEGVVRPGMRVLVHDDLLATGGTAAATAELIRMQGAETAGFAFLIELSFLSGVERLRSYHAPVLRLATY